MTFLLIGFASTLLLAPVLYLFSQSQCAVTFKAFLQRPDVLLYLAWARTFMQCAHCVKNPFMCFLYGRKLWKRRGEISYAMLGVTYLSPGDHRRLLAESTVVETGLRDQLHACNANMHELRVNNHYDLLELALNHKWTGILRRDLNLMTREECPMAFLPAYNWQGTKHAELLWAEPLLRARITNTYAQWNVADTMHAGLRAALIDVQYESHTHREALRTTRMTVEWLLNS